MSAGAWKETMSSRERTVAALTGKPYDRIPVNLLISDHAARVIGVSVGDYNNSEHLMAKGQIAAWRSYGADNVNTGPGLTGVAEAIGSKVVFPDSTPYIAHNVVVDESSLDTLRVPDPENDGRLPLFLEAATLVLKEIGDQVPLTMTCAGPFTTAAGIRGTAPFLRDLRKNPAFAHRLLRLSTDSIIRFAKAALERGASIGLADPTASGTMVSSALFKEFAFPYLRQLCSAVRNECGAAPSLHICGNTTRIWREMADTGASVLSLDDAVDLADAKAEVGGRVALLGNVKPTAAMYLGTPGDVTRNAKECIAKGWDNPKGYILGLGCGLPIDTPPANIHALVAAAKTYGRWPHDATAAAKEVL
ncbi:uroporphyrinogen decarboxylase family protein [Geomonas azotofigens]|uniref:uroporphyrinogen decarboxylase family protein n=1 Tax=Geomonas azotofigens TaxID=2843196 RepID=UPI001C0F44AE|nr:uroporphyrinogen decarboxylase family protein [Geomonas azotofigens]MBU5613236.1 uroporphyrinogen decarboxylase family protein [Geomonas azotofigens]